MESGPEFGLQSERDERRWRSAGQGGVRVQGRDETTLQRNDLFVRSAGFPLSRE
jgi:hypothetical protein